MLPSKLNYPEFVPDQLLTSEHLNQLFEYLEEQGRLSRTNLIGIGIVCGLEISTSADGKSLVISKGCGVTSEGYLVSVPEVAYTKYKEFNAVQDQLYNRFVDNSRNQRFHIDELKQAAVEEGTTALSSAFLKDKVVLLFVEILEEGSKNCNPNSCDDKGINVTVSFRPLLINKADIASLLNGTSGSGPGKSYQNLEELKMRRFDVPATALADSAAIFEAYQKVLSSAFLNKTEKLFTEAYNTFAPLILDLYPANPFNGLAADFKFVYDNSITKEQLINLQYYYDLFSDILLAYDELRKTGMHAIGICCPDSDLFPRHLILNLALPGTAEAGKYRHNFIPSPILNANSKLTSELRSLFKRLVLLIGKFAVPVTAGSSRLAGIDAGIRITPSKFGDIPLSEKSIPYYYKVTEGPDKLYRYWNHEKAGLNKESKNLSYHAKDYNSKDDEVINPLLYDLEPNNFLRIEGHISKPYQHAMRTIISLKNQYRLPFEVIALSGDVKSLRNQIRELSSGITGNSISGLDDGESKCQFKDLESLYDTLAAELTCMLCKEMKYFYNLPGSSTTLPAPASTIPQVTLLKKCDPNFRFTANSFGHQFEIFYSSIKNQPYISADVFLGNVFTIAARAQNDNIGLALLYYIEKLSESITANLSNFDLSTFNTRHQDLLRIAEHIKAMFASVNTDNTNFTEDVADHLDALIYACKPAQFNSLYRDYLSRWLYVLMLQKFAYFIRSHPGIQHKAGVTIGGTFILVYHEEAAEQESTVIRGSAAAAAATTSTSRINTNVSDTKSTVSNNAVREVIEAGSLVSNSAFSQKQQSAIRDLFQEKEVNPTIERLITDISNGTVIADFYLPYLCYSDCPPVTFILEDSKPSAERVTINIAEKEYCSDDKKAYAVTVSPEGGATSGEGVSINNGAIIFNPTQVNLQSENKKTVTLTYTKDGETATVEVVVNQKPAAAFEVLRGRTQTLISFTNLSKFAEKFEWNFGDGETSEEENPRHSYASEGSFTVTLKVSNGICSDTASQTLDIRSPVSKTCVPVNEIVTAFKGLEALNRQLFSVFKKTYKSYIEIEAFFKEFESIPAGDTQKQIDFFASKQIDALLEKWLNELMELVLNSDLQLQATALYKILVNLAMYIACIQADDVDKAKVPMAKVFALIVKHINAVKSASGSSSILQDFIKKLSEDLTAEETRIKNNKEDTVKPVYFKQIQQLIKLVK